MASGGELPKVVKSAFKFRRIPDKWKIYAACGKTIPGERLISFKTPLSEKYHYNGESDTEDSLQEHEQFTPKDMCEAIENSGHKLGLVVDFTNTNRYYNPEELTERDIEYQKIKCEGKIVPPEKVVQRFKSTILSFFKRFPTSNSLVGVHCTHGLNRAGYIVCRYLIDCKGYAPDKAIAAFNEARGHEMERENYLADLKQRKPKLLDEKTTERLINTSFNDDEQDTRGQRREAKAPRSESSGRKYRPYPASRPAPDERWRDERRQQKKGYDNHYRNHNQGMDGRDYRPNADRYSRLRNDRYHEQNWYGEQDHYLYNDERSYYGYPSQDYWSLDRAPDYRDHNKTHWQRNWRSAESRRYRDSDEHCKKHQRRKN